MQHPSLPPRPSPPPRPPPSGPPPLPAQPTYAQSTYAVPQHPSLPQPQSQARVNGGSLLGLPKGGLSCTQSAGPSGPSTTAPKVPRSPLRRSYIVPHSAQAQTYYAQSQPPQPQPAQPTRVRAGSIAGHKRSGSGSERLGALPEERERKRERERSEGGDWSASSGTESES